jgi:hypothetical protein
VSGRFVPWVAFISGAVVSVGANVLHAAEAAPGQLDAGRIVAAGWAPVALLLVAEMVTRTRQAGPWWVRGARVLGTVIVAGVAAVVSYTHMHELLIAYGQTDTVATLLPLSVDGLVLVASVALAYPTPVPPAPRERVAAAPRNEAPAVPATEDAVPPKVDTPIAGVGADRGAEALYADAAADPDGARSAPVPQLSATVPPERHTSGTLRSEAEQAGEADPAGAREAVRAIVRQALRDGVEPPSGAELAAPYRLSDRWGRKQIKEVRKEPEFAQRDDAREPVGR